MDSTRDMHPKNAGPLVFVAIGLAAVLVFFLIGLVWVVVDQRNERERCSTLEPGADLSGCELVIGRVAGKDLSDADLSGANLTDKDLTGTNLTGANLTGADLTRADLTGAVLDDALLTDITWERSICPDGERAPTGGSC